MSRSAAKLDAKTAAAMELAAAKRRGRGIWRTVGGMRLTRAQDQRFDEAERLSEEGRSPDERKRGAAIFRQLGDELARRSQVAAVAVGQVETVALAQARGEEAEPETVRTGTFVRDKHGATVRGDDGLPVFLAQTVERVRVKGRDGLASLVEKGRLDDRQRDTALALRKLAEMAAETSRSQLGGEGGARVASGRPDYCLAGLARAYAAVKLRAAERAIRALPEGERTLAVTAAVAVGGATLRSLSGGREWDANLGRLRAGLDAARRGLAQAERKRA